MENFISDDSHTYRTQLSSIIYDINSLKDIWTKHKLYNGLSKLFVHRLSTEKRLSSSNSLIRNEDLKYHPIYKISNNDKLEQKVSDYFKQAFGVDLIVNSHEMSTIPLHIGLAPDKTDFTMDKRSEYYQIVRKLPKLQDQGDGMRSFASILLNTFTSDYSITLIDEPEAFLHPPQARVLGKMLAKSISGKRQLFISTHSEDFLLGLLDSGNTNVTIIRINREENINKFSVLNNEKIKELWGNPLLRYSNILSGLFHEKVVVCESDYDCLFYQAIIDAIYEQNNEIAPDILFTHCGGKNRIKDIVKALKAVNVPVAAISDFDILNQSHNFKPLVDAFGIDWCTSLESDMRTIYESMNAKNDSWNSIKRVGKAGFEGKAPAAYENVEKVCRANGLFVVPVGEMECFDKTISEQKKEWVYHVLENYDLASETKLESARNFVKEIICFKAH